VSSKANKWQGRNISRWRSEDYDKAFTAAVGELDPVKRAALLIRCNDLVCNDGYIVPLIYRPRVAGIAAKLVVPLSGWDNDMWNLRDWYREA
jgi:peptide/nickel transport system substrate-binding protein